MKINFRCPLCKNETYNPEAESPSHCFCNVCGVFPTEVIKASMETRKLMAWYCRKVANETQTAAALKQAATWEKAAGIVPKGYLT